MSSNQAKSYHSITIGEKNTWDDWHLVPTSRPLVAPPEVKTSYTELIGGDGVIDLTENLLGRPAYGQRSGSWEFLVINYGQVPSNSVFTDWTVLYSDILAYLHGQSLQVILDDDPNWYYSGRLALNEWQSSAINSTITIDYTLDPYKRRVGRPTVTSF